MSAIADLFRLLESHFYSLTPAVQWVLWLIGIYSLSFLAIRFVMLIYRKWKSDGHASATALAMLLATLLWPAFVSIWGGLFYPWDGAGLLDRIQAFFAVWLLVGVAVGPVSTAMGLLLLVVYLARAKRLSSRVIHISVAATMFSQCLYMYYVDLDFH